MDILRRTQYLVSPIVRGSCRRLRTKTKPVRLRDLLDPRSSETAAETLKRLLQDHYFHHKMLLTNGAATKDMWNLREKIQDEWDVLEGEFVARLTSTYRKDRKNVALYYDSRDLSFSETDESISSKGKEKKTMEAAQEVLNGPEEYLPMKLVITDRYGRSVLINCVCMSCTFGFEEMGIIDDDVDFDNILLEGGSIPDEKIRKIGRRRLPIGFQDALFRYADEELNFTPNLAKYICADASLHLHNIQIDLLEQVQDVI